MATGRFLGVVGNVAISLSILMYFDFDATNYMSGIYFCVEKLYRFMETIIKQSFLFYIKLNYLRHIEVHTLFFHLMCI